MNISRINLNLLVAFDALITEKNVTKAGQKTFITQSAMSSSLAQLRELFDDPLLVRDGKAMKATPKALELAPKIQHILQQIEQTVTPTNFDPKTTERTFRIGMSDYIEFVLLARLLPLMEKQAPNIRIKISHLNALDKKEPFEDLQLDLGIGVAFDEIPSSLESELLFNDRSICVADANNPIMQKKLTLKSFLNAKHMVVVFPEEPYRSCIDQVLDILGHKRNAIVSAPHMLPGLFALTKTSFIATTTELIANSIAKPLKLIMQKPPFETKIAEVKQAWLKQFNNDPAHQWLRSLLRQATEGLLLKD